ncbi:MAG: CehA/McbA family metallohydrolase [Bryobacteraceae bacterium]
MWLSLLAVAAHAGELQLRITDAATGKPLAARVLVRDAAGRSCVPPGAVQEPIGPDRWFACDGEARLQAPSGRLTVRVERGTEYRTSLAAIQLGERASHRVAMRRWIDMRARGYSSGENHLHVPADHLPALLAAEDLNFGTSFHWWNGPHLPLPGDPGRFARGSTIFDAEVEHQWGALYLIGLKKPMPLAADRGRANLAFARLAREQGALICYQGGWSREVLVDALLGLVDVVNVCNNNFHRHKYQPRSQYSNLLDAAGLPRYEGTADGMMRMNTDTWYRLLNCGLRLAAGAGSATGAKTTPIGYNRAYVRLARDAGVREFLEAWRQGRNFVTNGPMLFLTAEGRGPGDTIALPRGGGKVRVRVSAVSDQPLRSLEIVVNGRVAASSQTGELQAVLDVREGSWIAARATAEDTLLSDAEMARYATENKMGGEAPTRLRFGHTSPVYVTAGGAGARVSAAVEEARRMLDAFERFAARATSAAWRGEILAALPEARARLEHAR